MESNHVKIYQDILKNQKHISEIIQRYPEAILEHMRAAIQNLKTGTSPGCDDTPVELIQAGGEAGVISTVHYVYQYMTHCMEEVT